MNGTANARKAESDGVERHELPMRCVLEAVAELSSFGAVSLELIAWELCVDADFVRASWREAASLGLIERAGQMSNCHEPAWRLTSRGASVARAGARHAFAR